MVLPWFGFQNVWFLEYFLVENFTILQMLVVNGFMDGCKFLKNHLFGAFDNWLKLVCFLVEPGLLVFLFIFLVVKKIFAFQVSLTQMVVLDFVDNIFICLGEFKGFELMLNGFFHVCKWGIDWVDSLFNLSKNKGGFDGLFYLLVKLSYFFWSFTLEMSPETVVTVFIDTCDRGVGAW